MRNATTRTLLLTTLASSLLLYIGAQSDQLRRDAVRGGAEVRIQESSASNAARSPGAESLVDKRLVARALDLNGNSIANRSRVVVMADTRVPLAPTDLLVTPAIDPFERANRAESGSDNLDTDAPQSVE